MCVQGMCVYACARYVCLCVHVCVVYVCLAGVCVCVYVCVCVCEREREACARTLCASLGCGKAGKKGAKYS